MSTQSQLTIADIGRLPAAIDINELARRSGINPATLRSKLKRFRDGTPDALSSEQSERIVAALREIQREILNVLNPTTAIVVTQNQGST